MRKDIGLVEIEMPGIINPKQSILRYYQNNCNFEIKKQIGLLQEVKTVLMQINAFISPVFQTGITQQT